MDFQDHVIRGKLVRYEIVHGPRPCPPRLEDSQEPIAEIARRTGFSSPAYLSSVFHAATGLTPRDYRKSRANRK